MSENISFFKKQEKIYPRRVWGRYRKVKWIVMIILLGIYYSVPWLRWDRGPYVPNQAVLIDIPHTRAYFFGIEIWPQEVYYITGILILAAISLFLVTSLFGRIWCGYACPQTVWTDLFVWVERIVQGDRNARRKLDDLPWTINKITKKLLTHFIWLLIALATAGAWVFYFNDAPTLFDQIIDFNISWSVGGWILGLTFSTYLMAGFAREQVCTYMCPYSRFQSAMFDKDTLIVSYDEKRGEVRGHHKAGESFKGRGHCIDCSSCVIVCPMGIDIRKGLQMECIACGLCIDACNNVMEKIGLPKGLIRYDTENAKLSKEPKKIDLWRPRTFLYLGIIGIVSSIIVYNLINRSPLDLSVLHDRNPLFVKLSDGEVRNGYIVTILNKTHEDRNYKLEIDGIDGAKFNIQNNQDLNSNNLPVLADSVGHFRVFVSANMQDKWRKKISFTITDKESKIQKSKKDVFINKKQ